MGGKVATQRRGLKDRNDNEKNVAKCCKKADLTRLSTPAEERAHKRGARRGKICSIESFKLGFRFLNHVVIKIFFFLLHLFCPIVG